MDSASRISYIQELMEEVLQIQKDKPKDTEVIQRVQEIIQKSNELVKNSDSSNELIMDAKILHAGSQVVNSNVASFDTNLTSFNEKEYCKDMQSYVKDNTDGVPDEKSWECLGSATYDLYQKSEPPINMLSALSLDPLPEKEKAKVERSKKTIEPKTTLCPESSEGAEASEASSQKERETVEQNIYEHILKTFVKCYKTNDKKPVNFLEFIMDPDSYWRSVQNIFYFSFLVRDDRVKMTVQNGLLVAEPILKDEPPVELKEGESRQFCLSLSMQHWRNIVKKFNITEPKIKPYN